MFAIECVAVFPLRLKQRILLIPKFPQRLLRRLVLAPMRHVHKLALVGSFAKHHRKLPEMPEPARYQYPFIRACMFHYARICGNPSLVPVVPKPLDRFAAVAACWLLAHNQGRMSEFPEQTGLPASGLCAFTPSLRIGASCHCGGCPVFNSSRASFSDSNVFILHPVPNVRQFSDRGFVPSVFSSSSSG